MFAFIDKEERRPLDSHRHWHVRRTCSCRLSLIPSPPLR